jgi:hypothetical protein
MYGYGYNYGAANAAGFTHADPPIVVSPPVIGVDGGGDFEPGCVLEVGVPAVFTGEDSVSYRFYRAGVAVGSSGPAASTYTTSVLDEGISYTVRATASNAGGDTISESDPVVLTGPNPYLRNDLETWTADARWFFSRLDPLTENPVRMTITGGSGWTPGTYETDNFIINFDLGGGDFVNLVHMVASGPAAAAAGATGGIGRPTARDRIIAEGDSITVGVGASSSSFSYPNQLLPLLDDANIYDAPNIGESARTLADMIDDVETELLPLYDLVLCKRIVLSVWGGTNDLFYFAQGNPDGTDGAGAYARYITYCETVRGFIPEIPIIIFTPTPRMDLPDAPSQAIYDAERAVFISLLRADHSFADGFVDPAADSRFDDPTDTDWYPDLVHGTNLFYATVAELTQPVADALFA